VKSVFVRASSLASPNLPLLNANGIYPEAVRLSGINSFDQKPFRTAQLSSHVVFLQKRCSPKPGLAASIVSPRKRPCSRRQEILTSDPHLCRRCHAGLHDVTGVFA